MTGYAISTCDNLPGLFDQHKMLVSVECPKDEVPYLIDAIRDFMESL